MTDTATPIRMYCPKCDESFTIGTLPMLIEVFCHLLSTAKCPKCRAGSKVLKVCQP